MNKRFFHEKDKIWKNGIFYNPRYTAPSMVSTQNPYITPPTIANCLSPINIKHT